MARTLPPLRLPARSRTVILRCSRCQKPPREGCLVTTVNVSDRSAHDLKVDVLVLATVVVDGTARLAPDHGLPREAASHIETSLQALGAPGSAEEVHTLTSVPGVRAPLVVLTGLGNQGATSAGFDHEV